MNLTHEKALLNCEAWWWHAYAQLFSGEVCKGGLFDYYAHNQAMLDPPKQTVPEHVH